MWSFHQAAVVGIGYRSSFCAFTYHIQQFPGFRGVACFIISFGCHQYNVGEAKRTIVHSCVVGIYKTSGHPLSAPFAGIPVSQFCVFNLIMFAGICIPFVLIGTYHYISAFIAFFKEVFPGRQYTEESIGTSPCISRSIFARCLYRWSVISSPSTCIVLVAGSCRIESNFPQTLLGIQDAF